MTESINNTGSYSCNKCIALEFLNENSQIIGDLIDYCAKNYDMSINPFKEPERVEALAYIEGARVLLDQLTTINELDSEEITFDDDIIDELINEITSSDYEIEFY